MMFALGYDKPLQAELQKEVNAEIARVKAIEAAKRQ
jgi:hypothetical protein